MKLKSNDRVKELHDLWKTNMKICEAFTCKDGITIRENFLTNMWYTQDKPLLEEMIVKEKGKEKVYYHSMQKDELEKRLKGKKIVCMKGDKTSLTIEIK